MIRRAQGGAWKLDTQVLLQLLLQLL